jgi:hypothetical protein
MKLKVLRYVLALLIFTFGILTGLNIGVNLQWSKDKPIIKAHLETIASKEAKIKSLEAIIETVDNLGPACQVITITMDFLDQLKDVKKSDEH